MYEVRQPPGLHKIHIMRDHQLFQLAPKDIVIAIGSRLDRSRKIVDFRFHAASINAFSPTYPTPCRRYVGITSSMGFFAKSFHHLKVLAGAGAFISPGFGGKR